MTYRVTNTVALPKGVKLSRRPVKNITPSLSEGFPVTSMDLGDSFYVPGRTARSLRGTLFKTPRNRYQKFVSRTRKTSSGQVRGVRVWRIG